METYTRHSLFPARIARKRVALETQGVRDLEVKNAGFWNIYNSYLVPTGTQTLTTYQETFAPSLPESQQWLPTYIEGLKTDKIARTGNPHVSFTGLDLFGQGTNLFSQFTPGTFTRTAANSLTDQRDNEQRALDHAINNTFVAGDYFDPAIREQIKTALGGPKTDVIFLKAIGGRYTMPFNPFLLAQELQVLWNMLEDEGVMLVQVPNQVHDLIQPWLDKIAENEAIEGQLGENWYSGYFLRLNRHAGAPEQLPFLSRREVTDTLMQAVAA